MPGTVMILKLDSVSATWRDGDKIRTSTSKGRHTPIHVQNVEDCGEENITRCRKRHKQTHTHSMQAVRGSGGKTNKQKWRRACRLYLQYLPWHTKCTQGEESMLRVRAWHRQTKKDKPRRGRLSTLHLPWQYQIDTRNPKPPEQH